MPTADLTSPENIDAALRILSWSVIVFAVLWFTTGLIGYMHRRAYNLTRAESGGSRNIKPDFLKVDKAKREAAIGRGEAYDKVLEAREAPASPVAQVASFSRWLATAAAVVTTLVSILGALTRIEATGQMVREATSLERLGKIIQENQIGAILTVAVIAANIAMFYQQYMKRR